MIALPDLHTIMMEPAVVLAAAALVVLVWLGVHAVRYLVADRQRRPVLRAACSLAGWWPARWGPGAARARGWRASARART